jgi:hypothetical protein
MTDYEQERAIYDSYPRHVAPTAAMKAIKKAIALLVKAQQQPDDLSARRFLYKKAVEYARSPAGQKPAGREDFRPHPATWFNRGSYFDDPAEWQKPNGASNGKQIGTKADRTVDAVRAAVSQAADHSRARDTGIDEGRRVQSSDTDGLFGRTIEGTV